MYLKRILKKSPFLSWLRKSNNRKILRRLGNNPYPQAQKIKIAIENMELPLPEMEKKLLIAIEKERLRLLANKNPLNDGTLGRGGLYDKDVTIEEACNVSKPPKQALLLYLLIRTLKPINVIELGTNIGISSAYIGAALKINNQNGKLITLDDSSYRQRIAQTLHKNVGLNNLSYVEGLFTDTLDKTLNQLKSVDLAFIDGHHQYQPTLDYYNQISKFSVANSIFIFDDIRWSEGMKKAWSELQKDARLGMTVDFNQIGLGIRKSEEVREKFVFPQLKIFQ